MASNTAATFEKRRIRKKNAGKKRKKLESKKSTATMGELFAVLDQTSGQRP